MLECVGRIPKVRELLPEGQGSFEIDRFSTHVRREIARQTHFSKNANMR